MQKKFDCLLEEVNANKTEKEEVEKTLLEGVINVTNDLVFDRSEENFELSGDEEEPIDKHIWKVPFCFSYTTLGGGRSTNK